MVELSVLSLVCGLILDSVARGRKEAKRLAYLAIPAISVPRLCVSTPSQQGVAGPN
jgi:hypothetical protein